MIRTVLSIIVGYAIFVVSSVALFQLSGQKPHAEATLNFQIITALYGAFFSLLSGYVRQLLARGRSLNANYVLAAIIGGFAAFSMFKSGGSHWTQLLAIFVFTPLSVLGGYLRLRQIKD